MKHADLSSRPPDADLSASCVILISSCDAYSDLWTPFFNLFWRYWPDCPFPVYLISNHMNFSHPRITPLRTGDDRSWGHQIRAALTKLDTEYVLLMLEDFFFRRRVDSQNVLANLASLQQLEGRMLRLVPRPPPDEGVPGFPAIGRIREGAPYRVSTQGAIWRRRDLMDLTLDEESAWEFELIGSRRSDSSQGYYSVWDSVLPYGHHVIERGKWFRGDAMQFGRMGIGCDFSRRPIMTRYEMMLWRISMTRSWILQLLPWPQRVRLVRQVRRLLGQ